MNTMNFPQLKDAVVLVTGGASGLGAAVVSAVRSAGGRPIILDRNIEGLDHADAYQVDVADTSAVTAAVGQAAADAGRLDAVVTAAGIDRCGRLEEVAASEWEKVVQVNLLGTVAVVRAAIPALKESRGHVVTIASSLGLKALPEATAYCASKFGVMGFSRALAAENRGVIGVTTIVPAGMKTHFFDDREDKYKPQDDSKLIDPARVADAVLFALAQPQGCAVRELVICHEEEDSWP